MARIRTIKPEFFRDEDLQDLEADNPGAYPMLVFAGLWGHCDSKGRFEWRPRQLKLDILPFLSFDMADTLALLEAAKLIRRYEVDGKSYGLVETFEKHQRLTGKEATEGEKHPGPNGESPGKHRGNTRENDGENETRNPLASGEQCRPVDKSGEHAKHLNSNEKKDGKHRGNIGERQDVQEGKGREVNRKPYRALSTTQPPPYPPTAEVARAENPVDNSESPGPEPPASPPAAPPPQPPTTTPAGQAAKAMRDAGLADANPQHPRLLALIAAGIEPAEFAAAAADAKARGKGFAYALATAEGRRRDAAAIAALPQAPPTGQPAKEARIEARAKAAGTWPARPGESWDMLAMRTADAEDMAKLVAKERANRGNGGTESAAATAG